MKKVEDGSTSSKKGQLKTEKVETTEYVVAAIFTAKVIFYHVAPVAKTPVFGHWLHHDPLDNIFHPPAASS